MLPQHDNCGLRDPQVFQNKAQVAENGWSFTRAATQCWDTWGSPFGRVGKRSSVVLRLLARTGPLPARRALRPTTSQLAESTIIMLRKHSTLLTLRCGKETTEYSNKRVSQPLVKARGLWKPGFSVRCLLCGCFLGDEKVHYVHYGASIWHPVLTIYHDHGCAGNTEQFYIPHIFA